MAKRDIAKELVDNIINLALESNQLPWQKPWRVIGSGHSNLVSKKPYRGFNAMVLPYVAAVKGYTSNWWVTYKQANSLGGKVRKGEKATKVVYWNIVNKTVEEDGETKVQKYPVMRVYSVFNTDQCDGLEDHIPEIEELEKSFDPIDEAEKLLENYTNSPEVVFGGDVACYMPVLDKIRMPRMEQFDSPEGYYGTLFHEHIHATGHESRLNRSTLTDLCPFGSTNYSKEELVAEIGAAMLCAKVGIEPNVNNTAAYLKSWVKKLQDQPKMLIQAAQQAQKAVDFITNQAALDTADSDDNQEKEAAYV